MKIPAGIGTWVGVIVAIGTLVVPLVNQIVALAENVSVHWSGGEKTALVVGAAIAAITLLGRFAQAVAAILRGS